MFEKEAEEYDKKVFVKDFEYHYEIQEAFKDGAAFGYNKANEWHYVKDGDLPKENMTVAILVNIDIGNCLIIGTVNNTYNESYKQEFKPLEDLRVCHNAITCEVVYLRNVIAWKEIVLPEFPKEIE